MQMKNAFIKHLPPLQRFCSVLYNKIRSCCWSQSSFYLLDQIGRLLKLLAGISSLLLLFAWITKIAINPQNNSSLVPKLLSTDWIEIVALGETESLFSGATKYFSSFLLTCIFELCVYLFTMPKYS